MPFTRLDARLWLARRKRGGTFFTASFVLQLRLEMHITARPLAQLQRAATDRLAQSQPVLVCVSVPSSSASGVMVDPLRANGDYKQYADLVPGIIHKFQGKVLARGGKYRVMERPESFHRFVLIEFPAMELATSCFESPEYEVVAAHRRTGAGEVEIAICHRRSG